MQVGLFRQSRMLCKSSEGIIMKQSVVLVFVSFFLLSCATAPPPKIEGNYYRNYQYGFTLELPGGAWQVAKRMPAPFRKAFIAQGVSPSNIELMLFNNETQAAIMVYCEKRKISGNLYTLVTPRSYKGKTRRRFPGLSATFAYPPQKKADPCKRVSFIVYKFPIRSITPFHDAALVPEYFSLSNLVAPKHSRMGADRVRNVVFLFPSRSNPKNPSV